MPIETVGRLTIDQVLMMFADRKLLADRKTTFDARSATSLRDEEGLIRGFAEDGTPMRGRIVGKSLARKLTEEAEAKTMSVPKPTRKRKRGK